jgi:hypothetical protein
MASKKIGGKMNTSPVEVLAIDNILKDEIGVALVQIESPFPDELSKGNDPHTIKRSILYWKDYEKRSNNVIDIVSSIINKYENLNIISLPEYTIPKQCWIGLRKLSDDHKVIIIGGSDYDAMIYKNVCPIIVPGREIIYLIKSSKSYYESNIHINSEVISGDNYYTGSVKLAWSYENSKYEVQIFICSDYLMAPEYVDKDITGIIICPMCSSDVDRFYGLAQYLIALNKPKYVLLNNACSDDVSPLKIIGESGICCSLPEKISEYPRLNNREGIIYAKLNLHSARVEKPKSHTRLMPISDIDYTLINYENEKPSLVSCDYEFNKRAIINPNLFSTFDKRFRIFYLRCKNYAEAMDEINKSNTYAVAVLGDVDVIVKNINDDSSKLRKYDLYNASQYLMTEDWPYFSVDRFIKYDGEDVKSGINAIVSPPGDDDLKKIVQLGKGQLVDEPYEYRENKWIIGDTTECEDSVKIRAIINIFLPDISPAKDVITRYEKEVLNHFYTDARITAIFAGTSKGLHANYVLEACCYVNDLFKIIELMHSNSSGKYIKIRTNTYLISKRVTNDLYSSLLIPTVPQKITNIIDNYILTDMEHDLCHKLRYLSLEEQSYITEFYSKMNKLHGTITEYMRKIEKIENKVKYNNVLEVIEGVKKGITDYLVNGRNINKFVAAFDSIFGLYDIYYQELINVIINRYFNGNYSELMNSIPDTYKPTSIKTDSSRLTFSERAKIAQGVYEIINIKEEPIFNCNNIVPEFYEMIKYRNILAHRKTKEIEEINVKSVIDVIIKMGGYLSPEFVELLKFPTIRNK